MMMKIQRNISITEARNIGPTIAKRLIEIGIHTLADLVAVTPVNAYKRMAEKNEGAHLPICYYLYSLQGALLDLHWDTIPQKEKNELRQQVEKPNAV